MFEDGLICAHNEVAILCDAYEVLNLRFRGEDV
jgi:hypothetical protein